MEPPPPAPPAAPPLSTVAAPTHMNYPDSVDSSPRSRNTDSWDEPLPPTASRLRLMCSYGGHIVPRPHDKSLCYVGGDTRIVVVDRNTSLSDLSARLSKTLLNGRAFTLKYQLPSEDLDSLISVTTDEDLDNMIDEYDRTTQNSTAKPLRLRLFLFPLKPDSSQSIGPILDNPAKSDDWFLNALNGAAGMLNRGFSDSASVNCLLGLDDDGIVGVGNNLDSSNRDVEASQPGSFGNSKNAKHVGGGQDVHSVPDSPMLETTSSFGSTSSSPSLANLPPIRVHVEDGGGGVRMQDQKMGIEEQFTQMSLGQAVQKQDEGGFVVLSSPPPMPTTIVASVVPSTVPTVTVAADYQTRVVSDDERSDHGVPVGYRKQPPPQPQQTLPPQTQQKPAGALDLPSPDSVSSDSSIASAIARQKPVIYQDQVVQIPAGTVRVSANPVDQKVNISDPNTRVQMQQQQQIHDSGYVIQPQFDPNQQHQPQQQQYIHATPHYIHHQMAGNVPISAYYPVYPPQQQHHHQHHQQLDQQYPVYYVPARQPQAYNNVSMQQSNISEAPSTIPSSRPQTHPNPAVVPTSAAYSPNPIRNAPIAKPEIAAGMYRTATSAAPPLVQVPSAQHQQQYVGYSQVHHPSQSVAPTSAATANYTYEYTDPSHAQIYYTQPLAPTMPSQYQTMTGTAAGMMPEVSAQQLHADNVKQQMRTSQPL
ncbi:hypothetical protein FNV43_RR26670 [Rhamnella rubrinervis]|uniref:PB1 domain-containing protein n=1 Tax=Rhamnella rubrinervis TaxID=2594499 RepID=A0A8K0GMQ7_9ROSA|nr:hypothetical protein FNV43_RR26670 [Rhamnella rubrinervis]